MRYVSLVLLFITAQVFARQSAIDARVQDVIRVTMPAFVFIAHGKGSGSGAVISPDGYALTNQHVVVKETKLNVRLGNGRSYPATVVGRDNNADLALLKIKSDTPLPYIKLGDSDKLKVGDMCIAIGNPLALGSVDQTATVSRGVISGLHQFRGRGRYNDAIVTDTAINPGNSGGPLINMVGELIGVNGLVETRVGLRSNTGLGYAIPANQIKLWLPLLKDPKTLDVYHGRLMGMQMESDPEKMPEVGALLKQVVPKSDAAEAGLKTGDIIVEFQGHPTWTPARVAGVLGIYPPGTMMAMKVKRAGQIVELKFELKERRPADVGFRLAEPKKGDKHLRVAKVKKDSPCEAAGMQEGDELLAIGRMILTGNVQMQYKIFQDRIFPSLIAGQRIAFRVSRKTGDKKTQHAVAFELK